MAIDYSQRIPNNVDLGSDRRLQRALENWQPRFLDWWKELGPDGSNDYDVYLRTAVSTDANGWANFGHVKMPDYRWGIFLSERDAERQIAYGDNKGKPAWQNWIFNRPNAVGDKGALKLFGSGSKARFDWQRV